jgi:hypothetical protein
MNTEATCFSETSVDFQRTSRSYTPDDKNLHPLQSPLLFKREIKKIPPPYLTLALQPCHPQSTLTPQLHALKKGGSLDWSIPQLPLN